LYPDRVERIAIYVLIQSLLAVVLGMAAASRPSLLYSLYPMMTLAADTRNTRQASLPDMRLSHDDLISEGIFRCAPDWGILFANSALLKMFGYNSLEEMQVGPGQVMFANDEDWQFLVDKLEADGFLKGHCVLLLRKDKSNFWGSITCKQSSSQSHVFFDGTVNDITEMVKMKRELLEKQNMLEKAAQDLDRFIYSASHDIRSPVSSIKGLVNIMRAEIREENSQRLVDMIEVCVKRLDRFVTSLTAFGQNSKKELKDLRIDFEMVVALVLKQLEGHPAHATTDVTVDIDQRNVFYSDLFRTRLALFNIVKNAFDYVDRQKKAQTLSITVSTHHEKAVIEIFDNGIGIPDAHSDNVFNMFYRASSTSRGSGMGLYIAREAVIAMGGFITLNSKQGVGTVVKIELPNSTRGKLANREGNSVIDRRIDPVGQK
jgi:signal transduction histidine kinase